MTTSRVDLHQEVTDRIIAGLEAGAPPWVQPWADRSSALGIPRNALTAQRYTGINILLLWHAVFRGGYRAQYWLTFRQAQNAGGQVRKGEHGTSLIQARRLEANDDDDGVRPRRGGLFLRRFTVFNVEQCDGFDARVTPHVEPDRLPDGDIHEAVNDIHAASGVETALGAAEAFYSPWDDRIHLPSRNWFDDPVDRERIFLHELIHATGHASRLDRDLTNPFGSPGYAREELVAELGAAFLCAEIGIPPTVRHASYIESWLAILGADKRAIFVAASAASKATAWLLDRRDAHARAADAYEAVMSLEEAALEETGFAAAA
jgi:antirestriction protein ArdC